MQHPVRRWATWPRGIKRISAKPVYRPGIVCSPDDPFEHVLQTMERHKIRRVPVVDRSGRVVGVVSQADIALRLRDRKQTAEVVQEISRPAA